MDNDQVTAWFFRLMAINLIMGFNNPEHVFIQKLLGDQSYKTLSGFDPHLFEILKEVMQDENWTGLVNEFNVKKNPIAMKILLKYPESLKGIFPL